MGQRDQRKYWYLKFLLHYQQYMSIPTSSLRCIKGHRLAVSAPKVVLIYRCAINIGYRLHKGNSNQSLYGVGPSSATRMPKD